MWSIDRYAVGAMTIPFAGTFITGRLVKKTFSKGWYKSLHHPSWSPPQFVFAPVWTCLYGSMGYASYLVYRDGGGFTGPAKFPLMLYGAQLALNWAWMPIFERGKLKVAVADIVLLWTSVLACCVSFHSVSPTASHLMMPYQAWLSFATCLAYKLWHLNGDYAERAKSLKEE